MNTRLLRRIQKHILAEPKRFIMGDVVVHNAPGEMYREDGIERPFASCGTMACIAGWALLLSKNSSRDLDDAARLLGLPQPADRWLCVGDNLFYEGNWPIKYSVAWDKARTPRARARVAARRIDHLIKTKGAE